MVPSYSRALPSLCFNLQQSHDISICFNRLIDRPLLLAHVDVDHCGLTARCVRSATDTETPVGSLASIPVELDDDTPDLHSECVLSGELSRTQAIVAGHVDLGDSAGTINPIESAVALVVGTLNFNLVARPRSHFRYCPSWSSCSPPMSLPTGI